MQRTAGLMLMVGVVVATGALAGVATVEAQTKLTLSNQTRTVDCAGGTVQIAGRQNTVTVTGDCRKVDVSGTDNQVTIDLVAAIEVTGTGNRITWRRALDRDEPRVSVTGSNTVTRAARASTPSTETPASRPAAPRPDAPATTPSPAPAAPREGAPSSPSPKGSSASPSAPATPPTPAAPPAAESARSAAPAPARSKTGTRSGITQPSLTATTVKLLEDDREDTVDCNGREVSILGSRNSLRLRGTCPLVIVSGSDNVLDVDTAQRVRTTGDRNRITWTKVTAGTEPKVENTGNDNRVSKADRAPSSR